MLYADVKTHFSFLFICSDVTVGPLSTKLSGTVTLEPRPRGGAVVPASLESHRYLASSLTAHPTTFTFPTILMLPLHSINSVGRPTSHPHADCSDYDAKFARLRNISLPAMETETTDARFVSWDPPVDIRYRIQGWAAMKSNVWHATLVLVPHLSILTIVRYQIFL